MTTLLSRHEVVKMVSISYPTIWRKMCAGTFPLPRRMGTADNSPVRWVSSEVEAWIEALPKQEYAG